MEAMTVVYFAHATNPIVFGALITLYYGSIPAAFILWYWQFKAYIKKHQYKLKHLAGYLLIACFLTSFSLFQLVNIYFYVHSPDASGVCFTSSCIESSQVLKMYNIPPQEIEQQGVPSFGPMKAYRVIDGAINPKTLLGTYMDYVVVVRALPPLPFTEVTVYDVHGTKIVGKKTFDVVWPMSPGGTITKNLHAMFTVLIATQGGTSPQGAD